MKKTLKKIALCSLAGIISMSAVACGPTVDNSTESNHCKIAALKVGYGNDWLYESIETFNNLYKNEGYSVELVLEDSNINSANEIKRKNKNDTDLYFDYNQVNVLVESSYSVLREQKVSLLEDLSDVLTTVPLNDNKQVEGTKTIAEKFGDKNSKLLGKGKYTGLNVSEQDYPGQYGIPYATSTSGIYVNKKALNDLGYTTDDLLTTDAILDMCDAIVKNYDIDDKNYVNLFFPIAYGASDASGYPSYMLDYWYAQYTGATNYLNFWDFVPQTGSLETNGYSVYEDQGLLEALRCVSEFVNSDLVQAGSGSTSAGAAQDRVFVGTSKANYAQGSLLMISGDWLYYEASKNNPTRLNDVMAIKAPIISALGMKLGLCGTAHPAVVEGYTGRNSHCDACEAKLKEIIKLVDEYTYEEKTNQELATMVGVPETSIKEIRDARGYIICGEGECYAFIPSYANAKKVAKLFLRHLFSDDQQRVFMEKSFVDSIVEVSSNKNVEDMSARELSLYEKLNSYNNTRLFPNKNNKIRQAVSVLFPATSTTVGVISGLSYSHKYGTPQYTPEDVYKNNIDYVEICWYDYLSAAGL